MLALCHFQRCPCSFQQDIVRHILNMFQWCGSLIRVGILELPSCIVWPVWGTLWSIKYRDPRLLNILRSWKYAPSQLFWKLLQASNWEGVHIYKKSKLSLNIKYLVFVLYSNTGEKKSAHHCTLFLFMVYTASSLFWNQGYTCYQFSNNATETGLRVKNHQGRTTFTLHGLSLGGAAN